MNEIVSVSSVRVCVAMMVLAVVLLGGCGVENTARDGAEFGVSGTFSIVAVDVEAGVCGAGVASKYPAVGKVVPYVRAGVGAFCTQHWHNPKWGEKALDMLEEGMSGEAVIAALLKDDERRDMRQLAIIDMDGRVAVHNPAGAKGQSLWWGAASGRYYACQGNTLAGIRVAKEGVEGDWFSLYVDESDDAVAELAEKYEKVKGK